MIAHPLLLSAAAALLLLDPTSMPEQRIADHAHERGPYLSLQLAW